MSYIRSAWYVAGWDTEIAQRAILERRLLDENVVMFRDEGGAPRAVSGVCPHRYASLAMGRLDNGVLHCAYHGLGFDGGGACVHNPFGAVPKTMRLKTYPVVERHSALWIWMGEADGADPAAIPDFAFNDPAASWVGKGYLNVKASYELEIENILDLSHIQFLHPTTLGSGEVANGTYEWKQDGEFIWSNRTVFGEVMVPELAQAMGVPVGEKADRWINVRWQAPSNLVIFAGAVPAGRPQAEGRETPTAHLFTPETATSSHYWFSIAFPRAMGPQGEELANREVEFLKVPFETDDLPMLEQQQCNLGGKTLRETSLGWLPGDAAGARARNMIYARIDAEAESAASAGDHMPASIGA
ncbi:vanillate O-demethylase monooxygenase subunit [Novosphingobium sp. CF614]|uniref:aromatic ring-hydroxylating dioxygenase subunit alpha n=1 Tax=Novosphingobium sp. CF614 TaxID=1884364 RepID=UPI0008E3B7AC|nr:aromatic ring-hydroxylating dioxygenase subunit alpha [Novosphingobium sp. CF614]SFG42765.1 vanillate O-demethylase monooxygenase subunit [Novosphingobium sp. CF614]